MDPFEEDSLAYRLLQRGEQAPASQQAPIDWIISIMSLTPEQYIRAGSGSVWHVRDLIPEDSPRIRLLFVLESPHVEELDAAAPVVGEAGKSALRFLQGARWAGQSLGEFIVHKHAAGDARLAVMNVSTVPLQRHAFERTGVLPGLTPQEWHWLGFTFRRSRAKTVDATPDPRANIVGRLLLDGLQKRTESLRLDSGCTVVACGRFAQRYARQLCGLPGAQLEVPHPANNQWHPRKKPVPNNLVRVRELFAEVA
ncbi:hypothetical protein [Microbacterium paludicola]|uniref:hypothetical protein n=1 Tax=Microbacterium paludicola TaxID=300019 RepID=UPI0011A29D61|nr:hypothetical protein [Microbacterium paludicola]